jgi:capsule polysaccharide export protein KpsE/RkpR
LQAERQREADAIERKKQAESVRLAEQQRQDAIQRELTRQKRLQDFMNDEGEFSPEAQAGWKRVRGYHEVYKRGE